MCLPAQDDQIPENLEPEKCEGWQWSNLYEVPEPRFAPLQALLDSGYEPSIDISGLDIQLAEPISFSAKKSC